jgi:hypothetical protein
MRLESQLGSENKEEDEPSQIFSKTVGAMIAAVVFVFTCIALEGTNHKEYFDACGRRLWDTVVAAFCFPPFGLVAMCFLACCFGLKDKKNEIYAAFLAVVYYFVVGSCLIAFYAEVKSNSTCTKAMLNATLRAENSTFTAENAQMLSFSGITYGVAFLVASILGFFYNCSKFMEHKS